jgi:hypothetical protein
VEEMETRKMQLQGDHSDPGKRLDEIGLVVNSRHWPGCERLIDQTLPGYSLGFRLRGILACRSTYESV